MKREATDVFNIFFIALIALTIWAVLWCSPAVIAHISQWYQAPIACAEHAPSSNTLGDVIRSRKRCV